MIDMDEDYLTIKSAEIEQIKGNRGYIAAG
jgi:hypothetical protein